MKIQRVTGSSFLTDASASISNFTETVVDEVKEAITEVLPDKAKVATPKPGEVPGIFDDERELILDITKGEMSSRMETLKEVGAKGLDFISTDAVDFSAIKDDVMKVVSGLHSQSSDIIEDIPSFANGVMDAYNEIKDSPIEYFKDATGNVIEMTTDSFGIPNITEIVAIQNITSAIGLDKPLTEILDPRLIGAVYGGLGIAGAEKGLLSTVESILNCDPLKLLGDEANKLKNKMLEKAIGSVQDKVIDLLIEAIGPAAAGVTVGGKKIDSAQLYAQMFRLNRDEEPSESAANRLISMLDKFDKHWDVCTRDGDTIKNLSVFIGASQDSKTLFLLHNRTRTAMMTAMPSRVELMENSIRRAFPQAAIL